MGVIDQYRQLFRDVSINQMPALNHIHEEPKGLPILKDAKNITLAEYDPSTKDAITAHHLKDYRKKRFNPILLPKIEIAFDKLLEGSDYWSELLHAKGPYS